MTLPSRILTPKRKAELIEELRTAAETLTPVNAADLSRRYGICESSIRAYGSRAGIRVRCRYLREDNIRKHAAPDRTLRDLAELSGMDYTTVKETVRYARDMGRPIPYMSRSQRAPYRNETMDRLPPHIAEWLTASVPDGGTVHELITAIIVDAYHEENDKC
jgi:hypothetical protein